MNPMNNGNGDLSLEIRQVAMLFEMNLQKLEILAQKGGINIRLRHFKTRRRVMEGANSTFGNSPRHEDRPREA